MSFAAAALPPKACDGCKSLKQQMAANRVNYETHLVQVKTKYSEKEAECEQLRQEVAKFQAQLKANEKRIDQLSSATGLVTEIYKKNAAYIQRAETAEKAAADAKKRAACLKLLARRRKNAMLKTKKENVGLSAELEQLKRRSSKKRSVAVDRVRHSSPKLPAANAKDADLVERPTVKSHLKKAVVQTAVQRRVELARNSKKTTVTLEELRQHVENASSFWADEKMKCPICKKVSYAQGSSHLMRHLMTHVASSYHPYKCPFPGCDTKFIQAQNVKLHFVKHEQSWTDAMEEQMCHEENLRRYEEFRELAAESALNTQADR